jgi:hypothetical protein
MSATCKLILAVLATTLLLTSGHLPAQAQDWYSYNAAIRYDTPWWEWTPEDWWVWEVSVWDDPNGYTPEGSEWAVAPPDEGESQLAGEERSNGGDGSEWTATDDSGDDYYAPTPTYYEPYWDTYWYCRPPIIWDPWYDWWPVYTYSYGYGCGLDLYLWSDRDCDRDYHRRPDWGRYDRDRRPRNWAHAGSDRWDRPWGGDRRFSDARRTGDRDRDWRDRDSRRRPGDIAGWDWRSSTPDTGRNRSLWNTASTAFRPDAWQNTAGGHPSRDPQFRPGQPVRALPRTGGAGNLDWPSRPRLGESAPRPSISTEIPIEVRRSRPSDWGTWQGPSRNGGVESPVTRVRPTTDATPWRPAPTVTPTRPPSTGGSGHHYGSWLDQSSHSSAAPSSTPPAVTQRSSGWSGDSGSRYSGGTSSSSGHGYSPRSWSDSSPSPRSYTAPSTNSQPRSSNSRSARDDSSRYSAPPAPAPRSYSAPAPSRPSSSGSGDSSRRSDGGGGHGRH